MNPAESQIRSKVRMVAHDADAWGSMLEAVHRLGPEWTEAALRVQRHGWLDQA